MDISFGGDICWTQMTCADDTIRLLTVFRPSHRTSKTTHNNITADNSLSMQLVLRTITVLNKAVMDNILCLPSPLEMANTLVRCGHYGGKQRVMPSRRTWWQTGTFVAAMKDKLASRCKHPEKQKHVTYYCTVITGRPSHGHRKHVQKISVKCARVFSRKVSGEADRHTDTKTVILWTPGRWNSIQCSTISTTRQNECNKMASIHWQDSAPPISGYWPTSESNAG